MLKQQFPVKNICRNIYRWPLFQQSQYKIEKIKCSLHYIKNDISFVIDCASFISQFSIDSVVTLTIVTLVTFFSSCYFQDIDYNDYESQIFLLGRIFIGKLPNEIF